MENSDHNKAYSSNFGNVELLDNKYNECSKLGISSNNISSNTSNFNNTHNFKNQISTYSNVSFGLTIPIHSISESPGQSLLSSMQVPVLTTQHVVKSVQAPQPQSLKQAQLPAKHNINQSYTPHSSLQSYQMQKVIDNAGAIQCQVQQTQPVINVMQNQNLPIQSHSIQHTSTIHQNNTISQQFQQPVAQANLKLQVMQHNMIEKLNKTFEPKNQSVLPNCVPITQSANQIIIQKSPQYYNCPSVQSQSVSSESSTTDLTYNQQFPLMHIQNQPLQKYVQLQQNQQFLPQQNTVQKNQIKTQMIQQNAQLSHQPSIFQLGQPQQNQYEPQPNRQMYQQHQQPPQPQHNHVQQVFSPQRQQITQTQSEIQQIKNIHNQNQTIHKNNLEIVHPGQIIFQQVHDQVQKQQVQQQQELQQQQIKQLFSTSQAGQSINQLLLSDKSSYRTQKNQVLRQQSGINEKVTQSHKLQCVHQPHQPVMQAQPQQTNQTIMHHSMYPQKQSLNVIQLQQSVMPIPTNSVKSTQTHIEQQQSLEQFNLVQQHQMNTLSQNNIQPINPISQQQMPHSVQHHLPINRNCVNSVQNCYLPSQQLIAPHKPSMKIVETANKKIGENNNVTNNVNTKSATIRVDVENKVEQMIDVAKICILCEVREEVGILKETIDVLMNKVEQLKIENCNLRILVPPVTLEQYKLKM